MGEREDEFEEQFDRRDATLVSDALRVLGVERSGGDEAPGRFAWRRLQHVPSEAMTVEAIVSELE